jgi:eukaryotic-like serine/threonine-protein kinase
MIGRTIGHYRILERLGGGGMGVVYKAEDTKLGRMVALKFLPPELTRDADAKSRFLREARAASQLDHANICTIYEIGDTDDEQTFIAMACYDGETLKERVERGAMEVDEALKIAAQLARGLGKAHASGIVHRDIKPANVIVTTDGVAKILDFGLAKLAGATHITQSKTTLGTLAYMAPEQIRGEAVGSQADLWALGIVLFELLTGKRPFRGDYEQAMAYSILNEQPVSLLELKPDAPAELERIVKKLLRKDPLQRYQAADELLAELEALRAPSSGSGKAGSRGSKSREALRAGARLGPYEIVEPLGSGGMGDVYRARDTRLDRQVAIKVLAPSVFESAKRKQRFQREAKLISSLSHPNICTLFDVGEQEGIDYLVMEQLEGETLAERLMRGALPLHDVLKIGIQIGEALGAAHRQGVVHRDLKPANVMLTRAGAVKLLDFGLAKELTIGGEGPSEETLTAEGAIVGTLAYMAPEQVEGREADERTDIFALGVILYEMATGRRAFEGSTKASLIAAILTSQPAMLQVARSAPGDSAKPRSLAAIEHVVRLCLEKDREQRWQSALDVARELRWVAESGPATSSANVGTAPATRWMLGACALAVTLAATVLFWQSRERRLSHELQSRMTSVPRLVRLTWEEGREFAPSISPDGTTFLYAAQASTLTGAVDIFTRRIGGEVAIDLTPDHAGDDREPVYSPDGRTIAFRSARDGGGIFLMGASGESVRRLTDEGYGPAWSPDGTTIAFQTLEFLRFGGKGTNALWTVVVETGERRKVLDGEVGDLRWSPSGTRIAFIRRGGPSLGGTEICSVPSGGGDPVCVVSGPSAWSLPGFAWHGEWIWFWSATGGPPSLCRVRIDEETGTRVGKAEIVFRSTGFSAGLSISRDGTRVLFTSHPPRVSILRYAFDPLSGMVDSEPQTVLDGARGLFIYGGASPDGEWLATFLVDLDDEAQQDIVLVRTSTGKTRRLTDDSFREERITWAPDGSRLYFCIAPEGRNEVWSIRPDGSGRQLVVPAIPGQDVEEIVPSPDGRALYVSLGKGFEPNVIDISAPLHERKAVPMPPMPGNRTFSVNRWSRWSPDGRLLLGRQRDEEGHDEAILNVFDRHTQTYSRVAEIPGYPNFCWLPDSRRILLLRRNETKILDRVTGAITPAGTAQTFNGYLSQDGRWFYSNLASQQNDIWMLDFGDMVEGPGNTASTDSSR